MRRMMICMILTVSVVLTDLPVFSSQEIVSSSHAATGHTDRKPGNMLRMGLHVSGINRLDPHFAAGSQDRAVADMVFNGLLRYQPGNAPKIEPDLAAELPEFKIISGRQVWTILLKKGIMFHPGPASEAYELTADDVVFSLEKSSSKEHSAYSGDYIGMTVQKEDRYTVSITLDNPMSPILFFPKITNYAGGFIVSKKAIQAAGYDGFAKHPVGTGPFRFESYEQGKRLILKANESYFRGSPQLDGVEILCMPDLKDREAGIIGGSIDLTLGTPYQEWFDKIQTYMDITLDTFGVGEPAALYMNTTMPPLDDARVRKAIAYALDRKKFLNTMRKDLAGPVFSPVPDRFLPGGLSEKDARALALDYSFDLPKARQLMVEAGYPDGFSLDLVSSEKRLYRTYYEEIGRQLSAIGITLNITIVSHSDMHRKIRSTPQALVVYVGWRPNADAYLTRFFHSDSIIVTGKKPDTNFSHYSGVDSLIEAARLEIDPARQISLWTQAQVKILSDMVAYPIMYNVQEFTRNTVVDYGHPLISTMALYPQITEKTKLTGISENNP